jgi:hypothetical protein
MAYVDLNSYLVPSTIVDLRVFRSVTDPLENGCLASVRPPDDKDPETAEFLSEVCAYVFCRHSGEGLRNGSRTMSRSGGEGEVEGRRASGLSITSDFRFPTSLRYRDFVDVDSSRSTLDRPD